MDKTDYYQGEQLQFIIRGSKKKRTVTAAIFTLFILVSLVGIFVLKNIYISVKWACVLIMIFWPLKDAYEYIEVTNMRIKRSTFSKITAKTKDIPLDRLAACTEAEDGSKIRLLFLIDDKNTFSSIGCLQFDKADENAMLLAQLPCPKQEELRQIINSK